MQSLLDSMLRQVSETGGRGDGETGFRDGFFFLGAGDGRGRQWEQLYESNENLKYTGNFYIFI